MDSHANNGLAGLVDLAGMVAAVVVAVAAATSTWTSSIFLILS